MRNLRCLFAAILIATLPAAAHAAQALTADRVQETTTTTGTGTLTLGGAVSQFRTFASAFSTGNLVMYAIAGETGTEWEVGEGTLATTTTLTRSTVIASSNSNNLVNFSAGTKRVFATLHGTFANSTVLGPSSSLADEIVAQNGSTGKLLKSSGLKMNSGFLVSSTDGTVGFLNSLSGQIAGMFVGGNSNGYVSFYAGGSGGVATISKRATNDFNLGLQATTGIYWVSSGNGADNSGNADAGLDRLAPGIVVTTDGTESGLGWSYQDGKKCLAADFTNATATMANLTGLTQTLKASRKYGWTLDLSVTDSQAAEGLKIDFDGGAATATDFGATCTVVDSVPTLLKHQGTTALATDVDVATATGLTSVRCFGSFEVNAAGTLIPRAAQNSHASGTLTIDRGSCFNVTDSSFN